MIIRMPVSEIEVYVEEHLTQWLQLRCDEDLIEGLENHLRQTDREDDTRHHRRAFRLENITQSPLFKSFERATQLAILEELRQPHSHKYSHGMQAPDLSKLSLLDLLISNRRNPSKREVKFNEKRRRALILQYQDGLKPAQIARRLNLSAQQVYDCKTTIKRRLR